LYPNLSAFRAPLTSFMLNAFTHATRVYKSWIESHLIQGELNGILQLAWNDKVNQHFLSLSSWLLHYPHLGRLVDSIEASELTGAVLSHSGLFIPQAGWINSQSLCEFLIQSSRIDCVLNQCAQEIYFDKGYWHVGEHRAPVLILATGFNATSYAQTNHLSLFPFKGQMTAVKATNASMNLKIPLCAKGHILPDNQGIHWVGATYRPGLIDSVCQAQDDDDNIKTFDFISSNQTQDMAMHAHWAGVRAATRDYLPLVGPVADCSTFNSLFQPLQLNAARFIPQAGPYQSGLYVCAGFGSRGLTTIPWSAEYLAATINKEPFGVSRAMAQSVSPARFLIRALTRC
jgi:tRNA 5-methylaminomethyl-2-thiouridine biosynthesis bifunctional protein